MTDVGTLTLSDFLLARIAEDEAEIAAGFDFAVLDSSGWMGYAASWGRKRALAECAAKRRLITFADEVVGAMDMQIQGEWGSGPILPEHDEELRMLRLLAIPYADHPDYRSEWAA